jgi:hypothetical protein
MRTILHLCADTGSDSKPYRDAGYNVILVGRSIGVENFHPPKDVYGVIANPVCTEFSIASGFHKRGDHAEGMRLVKECQRIISEANPEWWVIENPASGHLKTYLGEPRMTYEPWHFGDPWTKRTALWGDFRPPLRTYQRWEDVPKNPRLYQRPGRSKPSIAFMHKSAIHHIPAFSSFRVDNDPEFRSLCPQGFATAFFECNSAPPTQQEKPEGERGRAKKGRMSDAE